MPTLTDDERRRIRAEAEAMLAQVRAARAGEPADLDRLEARADELLAQVRPAP